MDFFGKYLKSRLKFIILFLVFALFFVASAFLYGFPFQYVGYPLVLCALVGFVCLISEFFFLKSKKERLDNIFNSLIFEIEEIPLLDETLDSSYVDIIEKITREAAEKESQFNISYSDMTDYYTTWAHQIKTPIASMRINLQNEDSSFSRLIGSELNRIEQYVDMALTYLRLDSPSSDYVFNEFELDSLLKKSVKRFMGDFIGKKLSLDYRDIEATVITDEKWFGFVVEQLLSNALKYTPSGAIHIYMSDSKTLVIEDEGMGISKEDLPRVFEKGYTGLNGRLNKKSSGLGLYLCGRICKKLGIDISIDSVVDKGTKVMLLFKQEKIRHE